MSIKFNLKQAILDNEVITSPENISKLAKEYLNIDLDLLIKNLKLKNLIIKVYGNLKMKKLDKKIKNFL